MKNKRDIIDEKNMKNHIGDLRHFSHVNSEIKGNESIIVDEDAIEYKVRPRSKRSNRRLPNLYDDTAPAVLNKFKSKDKEKDYARDRRSIRNEAFLEELAIIEEMSEDDFSENNE